MLLSMTTLQSLATLEILFYMKIHIVKTPTVQRRKDCYQNIISVLKGSAKKILIMQCSPTTPDIIVVHIHLLISLLHGFCNIIQAPRKGKALVWFTAMSLAPRTVASTQGPVNKQEQISQKESLSVVLGLTLC